MIPFPELLIRLRYLLRVSPFHDMQDHGSFPAASHSISRSFASATDPRLRLRAPGLAQPNPIYFASCVVSLGHGSPRGSVRTAAMFARRGGSLFYLRHCVGVEQPQPSPSRRSRAP